MMDLSRFSDHEQLNQSLAQLEAESVLQRMWELDHTIWHPDPDEITNRLGWLNIPKVITSEVPRLNALAVDLVDEGFERVILLGMGGSSLAPDVFRRVFGRRDGFLDLEVLDTTHPDAITSLSNNLDLSKSVFIVATKSGGTVETLSLMRYFYERISGAGSDRIPGSQFIAITDPGSSLAKLASDLKFREIFLNDPDIGGRYSALSYFGLVPAALIGVDVEKLLSNALRIREASMVGNPAEGNEGVTLGTILGISADRGQDKLTLISSDRLLPLGDWIEQLIAESTGKQGRGILPVVGEELGSPEVYNQDRLFVHLRYQNDESFQAQLEALYKAGHPVVSIAVDNLESLGGMFFLWELATAISGFWLGINPFDQPNVESAKIRAKQMVAAFQDQGELPAESATVEDETALLFTGAPGTQGGNKLDINGSVQAAFQSFIQSGDENGYISMHAYLPPSDELTAVMRELQENLRDASGLATTIGYGPRFLHSTGQLHKGDAGKGLFVQFTDEKKVDAPIPDEPGSDTSTITFGTLIDAQALGDRQALLDAGRAVIRVHVKGDRVATIRRFAEAIQDS